MKLPDKITIESGEILTLEERKIDDEYFINWINSDTGKILWIRDLRSQSKSEVDKMAIKALENCGYLK